MGSARRRETLWMKCAFCDLEATRTCLNCGRFACEKHSGDRLVDGHVGAYRRILSQRVCDACTPDQEAMQAKAAFQDRVVIWTWIALAVGPLLLALAWPFWMRR